MSNRTVASRLRRIGVCLALPFAFAGVSAQAASATTFFPANATDLFNDVTTANSTPGLNTIVLPDTILLPSSTQGMTITGNLEITGPPQLQPAQFAGGNPPEINAQNQVGSGKPLFTISPGANVIFKGFNTLVGGGAGFPNTLVNGGNLEVDNVTYTGNIGDAIDVSAAATSMLTMRNSLVASEATPSIGINNVGTGAQAVLINDTIEGNAASGVAGAFTMHNDVFGADNPDCSGTGAVNTPNTSEDEDGTCLAQYAGGAPLLQAAAANGGPVFTSAPAATSDLLGTINIADPTWCQTTDERFFTGVTSSCILGSYQPHYTLQSDTTGPTCTINFIDNGPTFNPNQMQVSAQDSGVAGLGGDAISNQTIVLHGTTTVNGTVSSAIVPNTLFDETSPGSNILDAQSNAAYPVLAQKPTGDTTVNDTHWSFTATDWFDNVTQCQ